MKKKLVQYTKTMIMAPTGIQQMMKSSISKFFRARYIRNENQIIDDYSRAMFLAAPVLVGIVLIESFRLFCENARKNHLLTYRKRIAPQLYSYLDLIDIDNDYQNKLQ